MAAGDEPVRFNRRSADLIGRTIKEFRGRGRGELPLPKRRRMVTERAGGGAPVQLAQITGLILSGTTPHYPQTPDLAFTLPDGTAEAVVIYAVLLTHGAATGLMVVDNPDGAISLDDLRITATDIRKEGLPKVGDIVRVWSTDGESISPGELPFDDTGDFVGDRMFLCEPVNAVEELRGLATWVKANDQVQVHQADSDLIEWMDAEAFVSGPGGGGGPGGGDTVVAGYGIDISGTGTVTIINDPTEWTGWSATAYQLFTHLNTATTGVVTDPTWATVTGHNAGLTQLLGHITGGLNAKTVAEWLNLLPGYDAAKDQTIGHTNGGATEWKDLVNITLNNPTSIELALTTSDTKLQSKLNYTPYTTTRIWATAAGATNMADDVNVSVCAADE